MTQKFDGTWRPVKAPEGEGKGWANVSYAPQGRSFDMHDGRIVIHATKAEAAKRSSVLNAAKSV